MGLCQDFRHRDTPKRSHAMHDRFLEDYVFITTYLFTEVSYNPLILTIGGHSLLRVARR